MKAVILIIDYVIAFVRYCTKHPKFHFLFQKYFIYLCVESTTHIETYGSLCFKEDESNPPNVGDMLTRIRTRQNLRPSNGIRRRVTYSFRRSYD
jgi:hypothetical protein